MTGPEIIAQLPYTSPFLFVDTIESVDSNGIIGTYQFREDEYFYKGHFTEFPVTPGVILIETMAQIGLVSFGIYLINHEQQPDKVHPYFSSSAVEFYKIIYPSDKVTVVSEKIYFRFNKLKCTIKLYNEDQELVCKGTFAGLLKPTE